MPFDKGNPMPFDLKVEIPVYHKGNPMPFELKRLV